MLLLLSASLKCIYFKIICIFFCMLYVKAKPWFILFWVCSRNTLLWKDFSCFRRLILSLSWKSNDRGGLKFWTCLHATVLLAVKYSAELNKYILLSEGYMRKIPVSRTVKCPSLLKRLGIFASPLNRYFSQITLTNRIYLYNI